jgi:hypothetical protein
MTSVNSDEIARVLAKASSAGIYRECYHDSAMSMMQIMLIGFARNYSYPFIRDVTRGKIVFVCLKGQLILAHQSVRESSITQQLLAPSQAIVINRNSWRATSAGNEGCVFLECIEGQYDPSIRVTR